MLFWVIIIFIVLSIILAIYTENEALGTFAIICSIIGFIALVCSAFALAFNYFGYKAVLQTNIETYKALTYKAESGACRDQFGLLSKDVLDEIQNWNEEVTHYKTMEDNFWLGIFYPDVYGDLGTIDYELYK